MKIDVPDRQRAANLFDESPEQHDHIVVGLTDQLEPVASWNFSAQLKGIQGNPVAQEAELEMELVGLPLAVDHLDGGKPDVLKIGESGGLGDLRIEAPHAEQLIAAITVAALDGVPGRHLAATLFASVVRHVVPAVKFLPAIAARLGAGCRLCRHCSSQVRQHATRGSRKRCAETGERMPIFYRDCEQILIGAERLAPPDEREGDTPSVIEAFDEDISTRRLPWEHATGLMCPELGSRCRLPFKRRG